MGYFDVIISDLINVILRLSELTGISANILIFVLPLLLLLFSWPFSVQGVSINRVWVFIRFFLLFSGRESSARLARMLT